MRDSRAGSTTAMAAVATSCKGQLGRRPLLLLAQRQRAPSRELSGLPHPAADTERRGEGPLLKAARRRASDALPALR
jgi:hypothetical protein